MYVWAKCIRYSIHAELQISNTSNILIWISRRLQVSTEAMQNMKTLKLNCWEEIFLARCLLSFFCYSNKLIIWFIQGSNLLIWLWIAYIPSDILYIFWMWRINKERGRELKLLVKDSFFWYLSTHWKLQKNLQTSF